MAVKLIANIDKYIGASTDTKPTGVLIGSEFFETNTRLTYVCYDGTNWAQKIASPSGPTTMDAKTDPASNAATTTTIIDAYGGTVITTTVAGNSQTLSAPTIVTAGKIFTVVNNDTSTDSLPVVANGTTYTVTPGEAQSFIWDGSAWGPIDMGITSLPVPVTQGGTGLATITDHGIMLGSGASPVTPMAVGATGEVLIGQTGADPIWSANPSVTSITAQTAKITTGAQDGAVLVSDSDGDLSYIPPPFAIPGRVVLPGGAGAGNGVCPAANLPPGMTPLPGYNVLGHDNFGNYQFTDGSIMVFKAKYFIRRHTWATNQITAATKANPCQITQVAHGYVNNDKIFLCNVGGMTQLNNLVFTVTRVDDDNYTIGVDSSAYTTFTSGGDSTKGFGASFEFNKTLVAYGKNSAEIRGTETYANEAAANVDFFALPRMFIDGGVEQPGVFVDKYMCSKNAWGSGFIASSLPNGLPLSSAAAHNQFADLTGGANYYYSAIDLAHRRDGVNGNVNAASIFFCASQFIGAGIADFAMVHGQKCQNDTNCAWYNATYNYPKGCNNNALKDTDDTSVTYASDGYSNCGRTGSGVPFAKTTDNGHPSGIADLNGLMYEIRTGITCIATTAAIEGMSQAAACEITWTAHGLATGAFVMISAITQADWSGAKDKIWQITKTGDNTFTIPFNSSAFATPYDAGTDPGTITKGKFYAAKTSVAMKTFTSGNTGATDHWGATGVAAMMDEFTPPFKSGFTYTMRYGSGTNQVLSEALSGNGWTLAGLGLPKDGAGADATGTNLFGKDYFYQYIINEMCLIACSYWGHSSSAGVWAAAFNNPRGRSNDSVGWRAACYPVAAA